MAMAKRHSDKFAFGLASDKKLAQSENLPFPSIVCHKGEDGEREIFSGEAGLDVLQKFIESATAPLIGEFTRRNEMKYMKVILPTNGPNIAIGRFNADLYSHERLESHSYTTSRPPRKIGRPTLPPSHHSPRLTKRTSTS